MKNLLFWLVVLFPLTEIVAQDIRVYRSDSESEFPMVTWYLTDTADSLSFTVYRAGHGSSDFGEIHPGRNIVYRADTLFFSILDTTLTEKGIWQYFIRLNNVDADSPRSEVMMAHNLGYIPPPQVYNILATSSPDQKAVHLSWQLRNPETVVGVSLFRSRTYEDGYELIARLPANSLEYTDPVTRANEPWYYFLMIQDYFGYQPPTVRVHGFATFAEKPIPPQDFSASIHNDSIYFTWRRVGDNVFGYRIYSRTNQQGAFFPMGAPFYIPGEKVTKSELSPADTLTTSLEFYCTAISDGYLESNPGDTVLIRFPKNLPVYPPPHIDYVQGEEGAIALFWPLPDDGTLMAYNIYRRMGNREPEKLNNEPVMENSWQDRPPVSDVELVYEIESINAGGKVSRYRTRVAVNQAVSQVMLIVSCRQLSNGIQLEWLPLTSQSIKSMMIYRQTADEEPLLLTQVDPSSITFTDTRVESGQSYIYYFRGETSAGQMVVLNDGIIGVRP